MEREADEPALEPVIDREREDLPEVRVNLRRVVAVDDVQEAARVVGEAPAVRRIAHEADARPAAGVGVLIGRTHAAGLGSRTTSLISTASPFFSIGAESGWR